MFHSKSINDMIKINRYCVYYMLSKDELATERGTSKVDKIVITPEGKKFSQFHSVLKSINVKYEGMK